MTERREVSIDNVRTLVNERQRYDDWLSALEARRAETPARVFDRVHGDYAGRRATVMEQLRSHVGTLASLADDLDSRLAALDDDLASLEDERVEAMLRTAVGEFDDDRWEQVRREVEAKISERTAARSSLTVEADDVRTLLSSARSEPLPEGRSARELADARLSTEQGAAAHTASTEQPGNAADASEAPVAEHVADSHANVTTIDAEAVSTTEVHPADMGPNDTLDIDDALALFTPGPPVNAGTSINTARIEASKQASPAMAGTAATDTFDDLAFLRSVIDPAEAGRAPQQGNGASVLTEPQKTLRCTECGTMNMPTEWYCERCGGELAAF